MELLKNHLCPHHPADETGDPLFDIRTQQFRSGPVRTRPQAAPLPWWRALWLRIRGT
jgi:molybdopterin-synthase adenylyltransferase